MESMFTEEGGIFLEPVFVTHPFREVLLVKGDTDAQSDGSLKSQNLLSMG